MKLWIRGLVLVLFSAIIFLAGCSKAVNGTPSKLESVTLESKLLKKGMNISVYLPAGYNGKNKFPVLYMFHGFTGSEKTWVGLGLEKKADELIGSKAIKPMIVVMPQVDNSYGINSSAEPREFSRGSKSAIHYGMYEDYLYKELIPYIDSKYCTIPSKEKRYTGGLSMGGFISLHLAFRHPELFSKVGGHSPALFVDETLDNDMRQWIYPTESERKTSDPIYLAKDKNLSDMKVYLDCGESDELRLYKGCEELYKILQSKGVKSEYHLNKGGHTGDYWSANLESYLKFYGRE